MVRAGQDRARHRVQGRAGYRDLDPGKQELDPGKTDLDQDR